MLQKNRLFYLILRFVRSFFFVLFHFLHFIWVDQCGGVQLVYYTKEWGWINYVAKRIFVILSRNLLFFYLFWLGRARALYKKNKIVWCEQCWVFFPIVIFTCYTSESNWFVRINPTEEQGILIKSKKGIAQSWKSYQFFITLQIGLSDELWNWNHFNKLIFHGCCLRNAFNVSSLDCVFV